jgi:hypothetical protein
MAVLLVLAMGNERAPSPRAGGEDAEGWMDGCGDAGRRS